ncbi:hypothetical protein MFIFM68171_10146 [Madurella fahalii]|uniref:Uncharacterized protein n=1 Tax=Madurella fahalii TaxID=1157608 RepID=A0ABQ0GQB2_9PEZI
MSAEEQKPEQQMQTQPEQQQQQHKAEETQETAAAADESQEAAAETAPQKPKTNPLKRVTTIIKTLFKCFKKPKVEEPAVQDGTEEKAVATEAGAAEEKAEDGKAGSLDEQPTTTTTITAQPATVN